MTSFESMLKSPWVIAGLIGVAGVFVFKDQLCPTVKIPFICDSAGGGGGPEAIVKDCADKCSGGHMNQKCMKQCVEATITADYKSNYGGYY